MACIVIVCVHQFQGSGTSSTMFKGSILHLLLIITWPALTLAADDPTYDYIIGNTSNGTVAFLFDNVVIACNSCGLGGGWITRMFPRNAAITKLRAF